MMTMVFGGGQEEKGSNTLKLMCASFPDNSILSFLLAFLHNFRGNQSNVEDYLQH